MFSAQQSTASLAESTKNYLELYIQVMFELFKRNRGFEAVSLQISNLQQNDI